IAARTDALILRKLDFRYDLGAAGTFLEKTMRDVALLAILRLDCWFLENGHGNLCACGRGRMNRNGARAFQNTRALAERGASCQDVVDQKHTQTSQVHVFSETKPIMQIFHALASIQRGLCGRVTDTVRVPV